jgi:hypothetical protein
MEGKINERGRLIIMRKREDVLEEMDAVCPFDQDGPMCGQWCALFGEPKDVDVGNLSEIFFTELSLCNKVLVFSKFEDERCKK